MLGPALFAGLPRLGWGVPDWRGFSANPARVPYLLLVFVSQLAIVLAYPEVGRDSGERRQTVPRQRAAVVLLQVPSLAVVVLAPFADRRQVLTLAGSTFLRAAGLVLFVPGLLLMNWAEASLGRQFSIEVTVQGGHQLVTGGPYRNVRHPRYLAIVTSEMGIALVFSSGLALILVAVLLAVLLWRIHDEKMLMHEAFGPEWETYARRSWRLTPLVY